MASVLQAPLLPSYSPRSHIGGGILLNPSPYRLPPPLPPSSYPSRSNQSLSSPTSSEEDVNTPPSSDHYATPPPSVMNSLTLQYTSDEDHVLRARRSSAPEYSNLRGRRIRFAPLPDPRRAVCVTDSGEELPLPSVFDDDDPSGVSQPKHHNCHTSPSSSLLLGDTVVTPKKLPTVSVSGPSAPPIRSSFSSPPSPARAHISLSSTSSTATVTEVAFRTSGSSTRFAKRLLKSLRQKNDDPHRTGSRDSSSSRDETSPSIGIPLGHWVSADDASRPNSGNEEPLYRARSAASNAQPKPKRMLNGRVYGARKNNHRSGNVFDNIPDKEPEFVEWGYGGMGSVRSGGIWSKVQSDQKNFLGQNGVRGRPGSPATEADDDGSGMGWVKKRREERERQKLEELAASKAASKTDVGSPPIPVSATVPVQGTAHSSIPVTVDHEVKMVTPVQPEAEDDDDESSEEDDGEAGDDSSGTEQEDDDGDQVGYYVLSPLKSQLLRECTGTACQAGPGCGR
jgi:hypothetical protein